MYPRNDVLNHPAAKELLKYAIEGCPVDCGANWTLEHIETAIRRGAHPSARTPEAAKACREEALARVRDKCCRLVDWETLKQEGIPPNLKVSPIAAIPHKSRLFRMILDLAFDIRVNGKLLGSVNDSSDKSLAPAHSMFELGNVIPRIVWVLAKADPNLPFLISKIDLKDGYWRMCVSEENAWNFAYVLPKLSEEEPTQLVVPDALQMGWSESPAFFCAATETARDVADKNFDSNKEEPPHELEDIMMDVDWSSLPPLPNFSDMEEAHFQKLLEVYIDDFIGLIQCKNEAQLRRFSRNILNAIYNTFPPPKVTGSEMGPPVSKTKLELEGKWELRKEILGWLIDGLNRTIELPPNKCEKLLTELDMIIRKSRKKYNKHVELKHFQKIHGRLQFAAVAMAIGRPLLGPMDHALAIAEREGSKFVRITKVVRSCLIEWEFIIKVLGQRPVHCRQLVLHPAAYQGFVDASKWGVGGVWFGRNNKLQPVTWFVEWPKGIADQLITDECPDGSISISELELAGILLQWLVLETLVPPELLLHCSVAIWCDNIPAVAWLYKLRNSTSQIASNIIRALAIRFQKLEVGKLAAEHIPGLFNVMADFNSREHTTNLTDFLTHFSSKFNPPKDGYWNLCRLRAGLISRVISELSNKPLRMASWRRLPKKGSDIFRLGNNTLPVKIIPVPQTSLTVNNGKKSNFWLPLEAMCNTTAFLKINNKFVPKQSKWLSEPSPRSLNWMDNKTRWSQRKEAMFKQSNSFLPATEKMIPQSRDEQRSH